MSGKPFKIRPKSIKVALKSVPKETFIIKREKGGIILKSQLCTWRGGDNPHGVMLQGWKVDDGCVERAGDSARARSLGGAVSFVWAARIVMLRVDTLQLPAPADAICATTTKLKAPMGHDT